MQNKTPFAALPRAPAEHFRLRFYEAVLHLINRTAPSFGSIEATLERFPFLVGYNNELASQGVEGQRADQAAGWWRESVDAWEQSAAGHLPLRALHKAGGLDPSALILLLTIGLIEEDSRFGAIFEFIQGTPSQPRPTMGLLMAWWPEVEQEGGGRAALRRLEELGLIQRLAPDVPSLACPLQVPLWVWEVLRGDLSPTPAPWMRYYTPEQLIDFEQLIIPDSIQLSLAAIPRLLAGGDVRALVLRGPLHNGRRTTLGAVARRLGYGLLEINGLSRADDERWRRIGTLGTLLHAVPALVFDLAPGETVEVPQLAGYDGPLGLVLGRQGGLSGPGVEQAITLTLDMPGSDARRRHWERSLPSNDVGELDAICEQFPLTSGNIRRAARLAQSHAGLTGRQAVRLVDVQHASRTLNRQALDTLAMHLPADGDWSQLAVRADTFEELKTLESRCRHRERLQQSSGLALGQLNRGVRALFSGPSGTGKTLAARLLAASLHMDLYRLDLASVVNKYIGETEKNLDQAFTRAEELSVMLLLDEGDALLTQRTSVHTSNDRYANLETNYLLQRIESFEGILVVTTNAAEHIDGAFQRRMDVVVDFRPPDMAERWQIWQMHLPPDDRVDMQLLREIAARCALTGGQIRNAALHATLLALNDGGIVTDEYLEAAVQREYRKLGAVCPLRRTRQV